MDLNQLPDELLHELFSYLDLSTLLTNCALVCKRWAELIHQMRIKELCFGGQYSTIGNFHGHPIVPFDDRYMISTDQSGFFDFPFIKMFENLKRLRLYSTLRSEFDFSKLNQFSALEELRVFFRFNEQTERTLKLPRLRVLDLLFDSDHPSKLTVDCPVKVLFVHAYTYNEDGETIPQPCIDFVHPEALEEINVFRNSNSLNLSECKNVRVYREYQHLYTFEDQNKVFAKDYLGIFPNLRELHYQLYFDSHPVNDRGMEDHVNMARGKISDALATKRQQNLPVKIFFQGIQLEGQRFFESLELKTMNDLPALQWEHYEHLATNLCYYDKIDYSSLEKHFGDSPPADLFSRFTCVNIVTATEIKHLVQFARFLKQCRCLCKLDIELDSVDQTFCDQLHVNCPLLRHLTFNDRKKEQGNAGDNNPTNQGDDLANAVERKLAILDARPFKKLNFDFLANQTNLRVLRFGELDMQTAVRCLEVGPSKLYCFSFVYLKGNISITGYKRNKSYTLEASFYESSYVRNSINCHKLSIDELASDLEFFKRKMERRLALESRS